MAFVRMANLDIALLSSLNLEIGHGTPSEPADYDKLSA